MKRKWENLNLKILSLLMAILLEVYFFSPDNSMHAALSGTLEIVNIPADVIIVSPDHADKGIPIRIDVRGPRPLIDQIHSTAYRIAVNYPADRPMVFRPAIDISQLAMPAGVQVLGISPGDLRVEFEPLVARDIPVSVEGVGKPKTGFVVSSLKANPATVRVEGPEGELKGLAEVKAESVDVEDLSESVELERRLEHGKPYLHFSAETVKVAAEVVPIAAQASFEKVNVKLLAPYGFAGTVEPSRVRVTLAGTPELLAGLNSTRLDIRADARSLGEGRYQLRLKGELPEGISIIMTEPELVAVQLVRQSQ